MRNHSQSFDTKIRKFYLRKTYENGGSIKKHYFGRRFSFDSPKCCYLLSYNIALHSCFLTQQSSVHLLVADFVKRWETIYINYSK